jgi:hypothetical protein
VKCCKRDLSGATFFHFGKSITLRADLREIGVEFVEAFLTAQVRFNFVADLAGLPPLPTCKRFKRIRDAFADSLDRRLFALKLSPCGGVLEWDEDAQRERERPCE